LNAPAQIVIALLFIQLMSWWPHTRAHEGMFAWGFDSLVVIDWVAHASNMLVWNLVLAARLNQLRLVHRLPIKFCTSLNWAIGLLGTVFFVLLLYYAIMPTLPIQWYFYRNRGRKSFQVALEVEEVVESILQGFYLPLAWLSVRAYNHAPASVNKIALKNELIIYNLFGATGWVHFRLHVYLFGTWGTIGILDYFFHLPSAIGSFVCLYYVVGASLAKELPTTHPSTLKATRTDGFRNGSICSGFVIAYGVVMTVLITGVDTAFNFLVLWQVPRESDLSDIRSASELSNCVLSCFISTFMLTGMSRFDVHKFVAMGKIDPLSPQVLTHGVWRMLPMLRIRVAWLRALLTAAVFSFFLGPLFFGLIQLIALNKAVWITHHWLPVRSFIVVALTYSIAVPAAVVGAACDEFDGSLSCFIC